MGFFELQASDVSNLNDSDLRELVARLCEAELVNQDKPSICVAWGGAQEAPDGGLDVHVKNAGMLTNQTLFHERILDFKLRKARWAQRPVLKRCAKKALQKKSSQTS